MKKLLLLIFISVSFRLSAQTNVYHLFPEDTATWLVDFYNQPCQNNVPPGYCNSMLYQMMGDTAMNSVKYNKIYSRAIHLYYISIPNPPFPGTIGYNFSSQQYKGAIRQDINNRKIYFRDSSMKADTLLYDFDLKIGDVLPPLYNNFLSPPTNVVGLDSILINGKYHKKFLLRDNNNFTAPSLVEGVGWTSDLFLCFNQGELSYSLACFNHNPINGGAFISECSLPFGITLGTEKPAENANSFLISPNPSTGIFIINSPENLQYSVYDVFGREILQSKDSRQITTLDLSVYPKGIYFVKGELEGKMFSRKIIFQ